jgi:hypothetical protein
MIAGGRRGGMAQECGGGGIAAQVAVARRGQLAGDLGALGALGGDPRRRERYVDSPGTGPRDPGPPRVWVRLTRHPQRDEELAVRGDIVICERIDVTAQLLCARHQLDEPR